MSRSSNDVTSAISFTGRRCFSPFSFSETLWLLHRLINSSHMRATILRLAKASPRPATRLSEKPPPLSLEHFVQRKRVLSLWRDMVRSIYKIPRDKRAEPLAYAKGEFERHKNVTDITQIRYLISTGKTEFDTMERYIAELAAR